MFKQYLLLHYDFMNIGGIYRENTNTCTRLQKLFRSIVIVDEVNAVKTLTSCEELLRVFSTLVYARPSIHARFKNNQNKSL